MPPARATCRGRGCKAVGPIEGFFVALVILFYIVRWVFLTLKSVFGAVRKALAPARAMTGEEARRQALEQTRRPVPSQQAGARPRRPDAGGAAITGTADSAQFRERMAQIEAQEMAVRTAAPPDETADAPPGGGTPLFGSGSDLVRAVMWQEILAKPLSQRRRRM